MAIWRVIRGIHADKTCKLIKQGALEGVEHGKGYFYPGDVIETDKDLSKHNAVGSIRFELMDETEMNPLGELTMQELRKLAEEEGVQVPERIRKADLLKALDANRTLTSALSGG